MTDVNDLIGLGEIADMAGVRKNVASNWLHRYEDFPKPVLTLKMGSLYNRGEVANWLETNGKGLPLELIEKMAENAHNAWWQAYIEQGFTTRKAAWGEEFMVPYDELSERGKEFDRMIMRSIIATFDELELKLVRKADYGTR